MRGIINNSFPLTTLPEESVSRRRFPCLQGDYAGVAQGSKGKREEAQSTGVLAGVRPAVWAPGRLRGVGHQPQHQDQSPQSCP